MHMKHVVIVGGGLAGLAAAYELSKTKKCTITLIEAEQTLGGRVKTIPVFGTPVDFGGFIIYPWYTNMWRIIHELQLEQYVQKMEQVPLFIQMKPGERFIRNPEKYFPITDRTRVTYEIVKAMVLRRGDTTTPKLDEYKYMTAREYIQSMLGKESQFEYLADVINQGYCYPDISEYKMAFLAPIIYKTYRFGSAEQGVSFAGNTDVLIKALASHIEQNGGSLITGEPVQSIQPGVVQTHTNTYTADAIICATTVDNALYQSIVGPTQHIGCTYTHFITAAVRMQQIPQIPEGTWGALFMAPRKEKLHQIMSLINLHAMVPSVDERDIQINVRVLPKESVASSEQELLSRISSQISEIFPNNAIESIPVIQHWKKLMPVADETFVENIRSIQGKDNIFFAGDFLGSPSMETATSTGVFAAKKLIEQVLSS